MIRLTRVLVYEYINEEVMQKDMDRWTRNVGSGRDPLVMRTVGELVEGVSNGG